MGRRLSAVTGNARATELRRCHGAEDFKRQQIHFVIDLVLIRQPV